MKRDMEIPPTCIDRKTLERVTPVLRHATHPLRLCILDFLQRAGRPCAVSDIVQACEAEQAIVSQHLRILRDDGVLAARRQGNRVFYDIADQSILPLLECIRQNVGRH